MLVIFIFILKNIARVASSFIKNMFRHVVESLFFFRCEEEDEDAGNEKMGYQSWSTTSLLPTYPPTKLPPFILNIKKRHLIFFQKKTSSNLNVKVYYYYSFHFEGYGR